MFSRYLKNKNAQVLIGNFLSLSILRGGQLLIPLITLPYLVQTIGLNKFGLISYATALCMYFSALIQYGFQVTATRDISRAKASGDYKEISRMYGVTLLSSIALSIISFIIFSVIVYFIPSFNQYSLLYFIVFLFQVSESLFPVWLFHGLEKMKYITYINLSFKVFNLICIFLFVKVENDYLMVPILSFTFSLLSFLVSLYIIKFKFKLSLDVPRINEILHNLNVSRHAFITQFAPNLYNNTTSFLLGVFFDNTVVGIYTAASRIVEVFMSFGRIFVSTFLPFLSRKSDDFRYFLLFMLVIGGLFSIGLGVGSNFISRYFYNDDGVIGHYIMLLSPWVFFIYARNAIGVNYLMLKGYEKLYSKVILVCSVFSFFVALFLIPNYGINGAISVIVFSSVLMFLITFIVFLRVNKYEQR